METSNRTKLGEEKRQPLIFGLGVIFMVVGAILLILTLTLFLFGFEVSFIFIPQLWLYFLSLLAFAFLLLFIGSRLISPKSQATCPNCGFDKETVKGYTKTYVCSGCNAKSKVADGWLGLVEDDGQ